MMTELISAPEAAEECHRQQETQQANFMMVYATYLSWLLAKECNVLFSASEAKAVISAVEEDFARYTWFKRHKFKALEPIVHERLNAARPGPRTGVLLPLVHAIE